MAEPRIGMLMGARSNAGDHLIVDRVQSLIRAAEPDAELVPFKRWMSLDPVIDEANSCDALVLAGGPAFQKNVYPGIYPLASNLDEIRPPIISFGLGWKGFPGDEQTVQEYRFDSSCRPFLDRLAKQRVQVSCRDHSTCRVLEKSGMSNTVMTGDPAWYHLDSLGKDFRIPASVHRIAFSTSASPQYLPQTIDLLEELTGLFPDAKIQAVFHHGWARRGGLSTKQSRLFSLMKEYIEGQGISCVSIAGDLDEMENLYDEVDLHVGYRLHAHLIRLSKRSPSFLLHEDGRGFAASNALNVPGTDAWTRRNPALLERLAAQIYSILSGQHRGGFREIRPRSYATTEIAALIRQEFSDGFPRLRASSDLIDEYYTRRMAPFVRSFV